MATGAAAGTRFQHIHIHSQYSLMWGTAPIEGLAKVLRARGQKVFPLSDRNGLYGLVEHLQVCRDYDLRPVVGCELVANGEWAHCLVKTREGYHNLCTMLTQAYRDPRWSPARALRDLHEGLIVITNCDAVLEETHATAEVYADLWPGDLKGARRCRERWGVPLVANAHAYTVTPEAHHLHRVLRAIDTNSKLSRLDPDAVMPAASYLASADEMIARFETEPKALRATHEILEACTYVPTIGALIFPPSRFDDHQKVLRDKTYAGLMRRYGQLTPQICERADRELDMIRRKGFSNCFLVIEDVVGRFSLTCGRGSAAASIVSYALGITHVDPIKHNLFFERFLNPGRVDPPDIDIDFAWDERDRVRDYLWQRYGGEHIAMVCNHNRLQPRSAMRELAKVYGLDAREIEKVSHDLVKHKRARDKKRALDLADPWPEIVQLARRLEGVPRHISVHCGGVVITPDPITHHCPLRPMPIGYDVVPWDKDGVEDYGFVKLDFLGNRSLAVIRDCLASVRENYRVDMDYASLNPVDDPRTSELIRSGNTMGCFYVESPATRQLLQKVRMGDFETLVAVSSIIRPAANKVTGEWIKRHRWMCDEQGRRRPDRKPNWRPIHPDFEATLDESHGLMIYQEDVTRTAMAVAGFSAAEGDVLRKIISKKHKQKVLADYREKFVAGCIKHGLDQARADTIWQMMMSFAGYSFCKPHSASYAMVSFKSAFLKFHYPAEFMAAVISNQGGFYSAYAYLSHARRLGLTVVPPEINGSRVAYHGYRGTIRIGFMQIKGIPQALRERIVAVRQDGPYVDLNDFLQRVRPPLEACKRLILAGCFDVLEPERNRPTLIWRALHWFACHQRQHEDLWDAPVRAEELPEMEDYPAATKLALERRLLGFLVSLHPLHLYKEVLAKVARIRAADIAGYVGRKVCLAGWLITGKTVTTKEDEAMSFLTFEDESDVFETVLFPRAYAQYAPLLDRAHAYLVQGTVCDEMGAVSVTIEALVRL
ncbi:DNA polymerase III subunit alpha [Acanthopleuribacter pedis]|uniref:DNA-directed DNA polymerase n=1 Tax=Acanthopleuribacter pedis TaxID=442870 RepID=A0A8J7Q8E1_9BACT|nr:DNA polymerase III subunit alpha [Acanthopleuribacter pedis]MBO1319602.1 DNA polymerase III subunit alpha [Acanthopleuribacter pedis]